VTLPRLDIDLDAIEQNARVLVDRLSPKGIRVMGVTKATLASPRVAAAMRAGGVQGLGDARVENLARLRAAAPDAYLTLIRSPMLSQVDEVVRQVDASLNTEPVVLEQLSAAAIRHNRVHHVVLMVELGDLREGVGAADVLALARTVARHRGLLLTGLGTNLACQSGIVPDAHKMAELSGLVTEVEMACGLSLTVVSGGNSANLEWALSADNVGRVNQLRLGESILLGCEPLHRQHIPGLRTDAFTLTAEVIEVQDKPAQPWGQIGQAAFGTPPQRAASGFVRQAILAIGRQDTDPDGLILPPNVRVLGMSSDHLVIDVSQAPVAVGDEVAMGLRYGALLRAMTSPFVAKRERVAVSAAVRGR
jgi:ornithine racemase